MATRVSVRELRAKLTSYLGLAEKGATIEVTRRGEVVAVIIKSVTLAPTPDRSGASPAAPPSRDRKPSAAPRTGNSGIITH